MRQLHDLRQPGGAAGMKVDCNAIARNVLDGGLASPGSGARCAARSLSGRLVPPGPATDQIGTPGSARAIDCKDSQIPETRCRPERHHCLGVCLLAAGAGGARVPASSSRERECQRHGAEDRPVDRRHGRHENRDDVVAADTVSP